MSDDLKDHLFQVTNNENGSVINMSYHQVTSQGIADNPKYSIDDLGVKPGDMQDLASETTEAAMLNKLQAKLNAPTQDALSEVAASVLSEADTAEAAFDA